MDEKRFLRGFRIGGLISALVGSFTISSAILYNSFFDPYLSLSSSTKESYEELSRHYYSLG